MVLMLPRCSRAHAAAADGGRSGLARGSFASLLKYWNTFRQRTKERKTVVIVEGKRGQMVNGVTRTGIAERIGEMEQARGMGEERG